MSLLQVDQIEVFYHNVIQVLKGVSLSIEPGQIVCLLGANGAGKSTTLKAISGLLRAQNGRVTSGQISFDGRQIERQLAHEIAKMGMVQVLEGRRVFQHLTVEENLRLGYLGARGETGMRAELQKVYDLFPRLNEMRQRTSGYLSGGEQQMMVIGRGLMSQPRLLMLDEPSLGLAPLLIRSIFETIARINKEDGQAILLVEQNALAALDIADYCYVMENGRIIMDGPASDLRNNEDIKEFYLGLSAAGHRKSYKDVKHYKRRKRWLS